MTAPVAYAEAHLLPFFRHHRLGESTAEQVGAYRTHKLREAQKIISSATWAGWRYERGGFGWRSSRLAPRAGLSREAADGIRTHDLLHGKQ
jgi:peptidoglycan/xylan/chitin deacetylase (PgdA/CDA1 family)